ILQVDDREGVGAAVVRPRRVLRRGGARGEGERREAGDEGDRRGASGAHRNPTTRCGFSNCGVGPRGRQPARAGGSPRARGAVQDSSWTPAGSTPDESVATRRPVMSRTSARTKVGAPSVSSIAEAPRDGFGRAAPSCAPTERGSPTPTWLVFDVDC